MDYDNEHNVSGKWQESLLASAETAKEYIQACPPLLKSRWVVTERRVSGPEGPFCLPVPLRRTKLRASALRRPSRRLQLPPCVTPGNDRVLAPGEPRATRQLPRVLRQRRRVTRTHIS